MKLDTWPEAHSMKLLELKPVGISLALLVALCRGPGAIFSISRDRLGSWWLSLVAVPQHSKLKLNYQPYRIMRLM